MVAPDGSLEVLDAGGDISSGSIFVEGESAAGVAPCLMPRRYRKQPEWWVVDVAPIEAATDRSQQFRLSCSAEGLWGTEGIEVVGPDFSLRIPTPGGSDAATDQPRKLSSRARVIESTDDT